MKETGSASAAMASAPRTAPTRDKEAGQAGRLSYELPPRRTRMRRKERPSEAKEARLWAAYCENRGEEHRNALWVFYQGLVTFVAKRVRKRLPPGVRLDELCSDGQLGLLYALEHFRLELGFTFSTYAAGRIRGAILDAYRNARRACAHECLVGLRLDEFPDPRAGDPALIAAENELAVLALIPAGKAREMAEAYFYAGWSMKRIAGVHGVDPSRVSQIIAEALREARVSRLRGHFEAEGHVSVKTAS